MRCKKSDFINYYKNGHIARAKQIIKTNRYININESDDDAFKLSCKKWSY